MKIRLVVSLMLFAYVVSDEKYPTNRSLSEFLVRQSQQDFVGLRPVPRPQRTSLQICWLGERSRNLFYNYDKSAAAVHMALSYASGYIMPPEVILQMAYVDIGPSCSDANHVLAYAMDLGNSGTSCDVFIGPGCGSNLDSVYGYVDFLQRPIIGCPAAGVGTSADLSSYSLLTRISVTHSNTAKVLQRFLQMYGYSAPMYLADVSDSVYQQMAMVIEAYMRKNTDYNPNMTRPFRKNSVNRKFYEEALRFGNSRTRIFIILANAATVRKIMIIAKQLGMTSPEYVFVAIELFKSLSWGYFTSQAGDADDEVAHQAFESLLIISVAENYDPYIQNFYSEVKKRSPAYGYQYKTNEEPDAVVTHFYDAIIMYASLVADVVKAGGNVKDPRQVVDLYSSGNYSFRSPLNGLVVFDENADRVCTYTLKCFYPDSNKFESFLEFLPSGETNQLGTVRLAGGNQLPPNAPRCGYLGDDPACRPESVNVAAVVVPIILVILIAVAGFLFWRFARPHSDPFWWRILLSDLQVIATTSPSRYNASSVAARSTITQNSIGRDGLKERDGVSVHTATVTDRGSFLSSLYSSIATYQGQRIALRELPEPRKRAFAMIGKELLPMKNIMHQNLQQFYGIVVNDENLCEFVAGEICQKGNLLRLVVKNTTMDLDWFFKNALIKDIISGMTYLHGSALASHGNLSAYTCLVDSRFVLKITDYGLWSFRKPEDLEPYREKDHEERDLEVLLWRAPELLRIRMDPEGTQKGDVYSFAIILQQIILRSLPFEFPGKERSDNDHTREILTEIKHGGSSPLRPRVPISACNGKLFEMMQLCWDEEPADRPAFQKIQEGLKKVLGKSSEGIIDHLIRAMEVYSSKLEYEAEMKTKQFMNEKQRSDELLNELLPKLVAQSLTKGLIVPPEKFNSISVFFSHLDGFNDIVLEKDRPLDVINVLNELYAVCDEVISMFDAYKCDVVNDLYMVASGVPVPNGIAHAVTIASLALALLREVSGIKLTNHLTEKRFRLRGGVNSGSCVAGIVGHRLPKYCLFGDTINTASRMESSGQAGRIQASETTEELLKENEDFMFAERGQIEVKGKGQMKTYWLSGYTSLPRIPSQRQKAVVGLDQVETVDKVSELRAAGASAAAGVRFARNKRRPSIEKAE